MFNLNDTEEEQEVVSRLETPHKKKESVSKRTSKKQEELENKIYKIVEKYPQVLQSRGKKKMPPTHISLKDNNKTPVVEKLCPLAIHL